MTTDVLTIIELNIQHYRRLLTTEGDPPKREMITKLLADEQKKLAAHRERNARIDFDSEPRVAETFS